jgi:pSer/pThr/pTyr-binding forkhead associated (FHA) protein
VLLALGAALAAFGLRARSRERRPDAAERHPVVDAASASETVVARMNITEEYLEKTVTLRESPALVVTHGVAVGQMLLLNPEVTTSIGRAKANDIVLEDLSVSSQHCRVRPEDGRFVLLDLKSTNGTFVNARRVTRHPLTEGDVIKVGETALQFLMKGVPDRLS